MVDAPLLLAAAGAMALGVLLGWWVAQLAQRAERERHRRELERAIDESRIDPLTRAANRKGFDERLAAQAAVSRRYETPCALILIDVDDLKTINDRGGHPAGDQVLRDLAALLQASLRESDLLSRYGGDEFAILLPSTDLSGALAAGTRILSRLAASTGQGNPAGQGPRAFPMHVSLGAAEFRRDESEADFLSRADQALYTAKRAGGDRLGVHDGIHAVAAPVSVPATGRSDSSFPPDADRGGRPA